MTAAEVYQTAILPLPASERLQVASLILRGIPPESVIDYSTEWSDDDLKEFSQAGWHYTERRLEEDANA